MAINALAGRHTYPGPEFLAERIAHVGTLHSDSTSTCRYLDRWQVVAATPTRANARSVTHRSNPQTQSGRPTGALFTSNAGSESVRAPRSVPVHRRILNDEREAAPPADRA